MIIIWKESLFQVTICNTNNLNSVYDFKYSNLIQIIYIQLYGFKYSYIIQVIYIQLYDFKYSYLIQIIYIQLYGFKYSNLIQIIHIQLYGFKYPYLIQISCTLLHGFKHFKQLYGFKSLICPVSWGHRIHQLHLGRGVRPPPNKWDDTKQSDGEISVLLELWGMQSTPSFPSLPDPFWPGVVAPDWVLSMGQIRLYCSFEIYCFCIETAYLCKTELLEIELFWALKLYLC